MPTKEQVMQELHYYDKTTYRAMLDEFRLVDNNPSFAVVGGKSQKLVCNTWRRLSDDYGCRSFWNILFNTMDAFDRSLREKCGNQHSYPTAAVYQLYEKQVTEYFSTTSEKHFVENMPDFLAKFISENYDAIYQLTIDRYRWDHRYVIKQPISILQKLYKWLGY